MSGEIKICGYVWLKHQGASKAHGIDKKLDNSYKRAVRLRHLFLCLSTLCLFYHQPSYHHLSVHLSDKYVYLSELQMEGYTDRERPSHTPARRESVFHTHDVHVVYEK